MLDELQTLFLSIPAMAFLGLVVGSFLNVVIHRVPIMVERAEISDAALTLEDEGIWDRIGDAGSKALPATSRLAVFVQDRLDALPALTLNIPHSHCPRCGHRIPWFENIPLLSWLRLRGKCSNCGSRISARYPLIELGTGILFAFIAWRVGPLPAALAWAGFAAAVLAASVIDWETTLLPDAITMPLLWIGLLVSVGGLTLPVSQAVIGAVAGYTVPWAIARLYERLAGKPVMAAGDFKLLAAIGAWMGWQLVLATLLLAFIAGGAMFALLGLRAEWRERYVAFGPYLGAVAVCFALIGPRLVAAWL